MSNNIKHYRENMGMTQQHLAEYCGCARRTIVDLESGKYNPSWDLLDKVSDCLRVSVYKLMGDCRSKKFYDFELEDVYREGRHSFVEDVLGRGEF